MTSFLLCDDHGMVLHGLRQLVSERVGWTIAAEAPDGLEALAQLEMCRPDVAVTDLTMPGLTGLDLLVHGRAVSPSTRFIVLSMHSDPEYAAAALARGAAAYVTKEAAVDHLIVAIDHVLAGDRYVSPPLQLDAVLGVVSEPVADPLEALTPRERQVFFATAQGGTAEEIAEQLIISRRTVEVHRQHIYEKLELDGQGQLVAFAHREHLLHRAREAAARDEHT